MGIACVFEVDVEGSQPIEAEAKLFAAGKLEIQPRLTKTIKRVKLLGFR